MSKREDEEEDESLRTEEEASTALEEDSDQYEDEEEASVGVNNQIQALVSGKASKVCISKSEKKLAVSAPTSRSSSSGSYRSFHSKSLRFNFFSKYQNTMKERKNSSSFDLLSLSTVILIILQNFIQHKHHQGKKFLSRF